MLHLEVRDNGGGIAPEAMASLFQRGFSTKQGKKGGIGLHWCANSVIAMNGKIHATSDGAGLGRHLPPAPAHVRPSAPKGRTQAALRPSHAGPLPLAGEGAPHRSAQSR